MIITIEAARQDWLMRLRRQAYELRTIADLATDRSMKDELHDYAGRIDQQMRDLAEAAWLVDVG